jgi:hypothetical protein
VEPPVCQSVAVFSVVQISCRNDSHYRFAED